MTCGENNFDKMWISSNIVYNSGKNGSTLGISLVTADLTYKNSKATATTSQSQILYTSEKRV
jgi:hypothetical protein